MQLKLITYYFLPSEWKILSPKIASESVSVEIIESQSQIQINFSEADHALVKKLTD